ncbi:MAG: sulfatase-like hydrolase/transferase [Actinomycetota bacterium]
MADRPRVLHPLLFATFPVLSLYAANLHEGVTLGHVLPVLAVVLGVTAAAMLAARWAFRDLATAGVVVSALVLLFFSYGHVKNVILEWGVAGVLSRHRYLLAAWALLAVAAVVVAPRVRAHLPRITGVLNLVSAALVLVNVASAALYEGRRSLAGREAPLPETLVLHPPSSGSLPDIYYVVLDRYGGQDALREVFGFDNRDFLEFLEGQGFVVASKGRANYPRTNFSLASSLNLEYLDFLTRSEGPASDDTRPLVSLIREHRLGRSLKAIGYRYLHIGSWWAPTASNPMADVSVPYGGLSEFSSVLLQTTPVWPVANFVVGGLGRRRDWAGVQQQFDAVIQSRDIPGPKLVFAHIISPHEPFVFDSNGNFVSEEEEARRQRKESYIQQLQYVNRRVQEVVEALLAGPDDPVIVIQADEGPYEGPGSWRRAPDRLLRRKFSILNAYFLPGQGSPDPHRSITPVNTFRLVFDRYFGAALPLLSDRSYVFAGLRHLYEFVDVTDRVGEASAPPMTG